MGQGYEITADRGLTVDEILTLSRKSWSQKQRHPTSAAAV